MKESNIDELIIRVLDGTASQEEQSAVQDWVNTSEANKEVFEETQAIWIGASDAALLEQINVDTDWKKVKAQFKPEIGETKTPMRRLGVSRIWRAVAATLVFGILSFSIYFYLNTGLTSIEQYTLSDGTKVWVEKGSAFQYPEQFETNQRVVQLKGKAFFEVAKDANRPFTIKSGRANIQVLGTSFNVVSSDTLTEVIVQTGKVRLQEQTQPESYVDLEPQEKGRLQTDTIVKKVNDNPNFLSWKTGVFTFDETPIERVLQDLESFYPEELTISNNFKSNCYFTAKFDNKALLDIIKTIAFSCDLDYKRTKKGYQFYAK